MLQVRDIFEDNARAFENELFSFFRPTQCVGAFVENKREKYKLLSCDKTVESFFLMPFRPGISGKSLSAAQWARLITERPDGHGVPWNGRYRLSKIACGDMPSQLLAKYQMLITNDCLQNTNGAASPKARCADVCTMRRFPVKGKREKGQGVFHRADDEAQRGQKGSCRRRT